MVTLSFRKPGHNEQTPAATRTRRAGRWRRRAVWLLAVFFAIVVAVVAAGWWATRDVVVTPPVDPANPVTVYLLDEGRHTGLLMPTAGGRLVEYTYGDWQWYALRHTGLYRGIAAPFWPTQATLGRNFFPGPADEEHVREAFGPTCRQIYCVTVSKDGVERLEENLNRRFEENIETLVVNEPYHLDFVKDPKPYSIAHDSNNEVAIWLRDLGCRVEGTVILARWEIRSADDATTLAAQEPPLSH